MKIPIGNRTKFIVRKEFYHTHTSHISASEHASLEFTHERVPTVFDRLRLRRIAPISVDASRARIFLLPHAHITASLRPT